MPIRNPKPTSPGRRFVTYPDFAEITRDEPEKSLTEGLKKSGGRNSNGRKTVAPPRWRRQAAVPQDRLQAAARTACRRRSRTSSTTRTAPPTSRCCTTPTARSATSSRPQRLRVGATVESGPGADIRVGNSLPLANMPPGTVVHNVELTPGRGGQMARSAGVGIQLLAKDGDYVTLRLPSGEMRMVRAECRATVGVIGNSDHQNVKIGKAGRKRHMGVRPQTRGTAMNPVDHPHGGGEGSTTPGRHPVTPWGVPTLGYRTRKKRKASDRYIVRGRRRGKKR